MGMSLNFSVYAGLLCGFVGGITGVIAKYLDASDKSGENDTENVFFCFKLEVLPICDYT